MGRQQAAEPSDFAAQFEHITGARRLDQVLWALVREVVHQHQRAATQGVAPEEFHPHHPGLEEAFDLAQVLGSQRQTPQTEVDKRHAAVLDGSVFENPRW